MLKFTENVRPQVETNHSIILLSIERKGRKNLREDGLEISFFLNNQEDLSVSVGKKEEIRRGRSKRHGNNGGCQVLEKASGD